MFWALVSLLVIFAVIRFFIWAIRSFFAWLGRGKPIQRAIDQGNVPDDVRQAKEELEAWRVQLRLDRKAARANKPSLLTRGQLRQVQQAEHLVRENFLDNLRITWYQVVIVFLVGAVGGLVLEEIWMYITAGLTESRVGLVWGPFSPLYGVGATALTLISFYLRKKKATWWQIFLVSLIVGGLLEQITGWGMETLMGATSWDYTNVPGAITKWVAWPFLIFWGLLGLVWCKLIMPNMLYIIGEPTTRRQVWFVALLAAYLVADIFMTLACFNRRAERDAGIPPATAFDQWVDEHYSDEFMSSRFQNMVINPTAETLAKRVSD